MRYIKGRLVVFTALMFLVCFQAFSAQSPREFFPTQHKDASSVMPVSSSLGTLCDHDVDEAHDYLFNALAAEFSLDWCDANFNADVKAPLTKIYSPFLTEHLPAGSLLMGVGITNGDGSHSIPVLFSDGTRVSFTVLDQSIVAINIL